MASRCAYCGGPASTADHVIPRCLYPESTRMQGPQLITVSSCAECNSGFSDDEEHFRNVITVAGQNTEVASELYHKKVYKSFSEGKSVRHFRQLVSMLKLVDTATGKRHMIYPMRDQKFERILKKILRGLGYYHFHGCVPSDGLRVDVVKSGIPAFIAEAQWINVVPEVFQYLFGVYLVEEGLCSCWMLKFFESRLFTGMFEMTNEMAFDIKEAVDLREELRAR